MPNPPTGAEHDHLQGFGPDLKHAGQLGVPHPLDLDHVHDKTLARAERAEGLEIDGEE